VPQRSIPGCAVDETAQSSTAEHSGLSGRAGWFSLAYIHCQPFEFGNLAWPTSAVCFGPPLWGLMSTFVVRNQMDARTVYASRFHSENRRYHEERGHDPSGGEGDVAECGSQARLFEEA